LLARGYQRLIFDDTSARRFICDNFSSRHVEAFERCRHPAMRCDYFRLCYLVRLGGFYVDADEVYKGGECDFLFDDDRLKVQPLCYDTTTGEMVGAESFMQRQKAPPGWTYYVNNNPIIAPPDHAVLRSALARASQLLLEGSASRLGVQSTTGPGTSPPAWSPMRSSVRGRRSRRTMCLPATVGLPLGEQVAPQLQARRKELAALGPGRMTHLRRAARPTFSHSWPYSKLLARRLARLR